MTRMGVRGDLFCKRPPLGKSIKSWRLCGDVTCLNWSKKAKSMWTVLRNCRSPAKAYCKVCWSEISTDQLVHVHWLITSKVSSIKGRSRPLIATFGQSHLKKKGSVNDKDECKESQAVPSQTVSSSRISLSIHTEVDKSPSPYIPPPSPIAHSPISLTQLFPQPLSLIDIYSFHFSRFLSWSYFLLVALCLLLFQMLVDFFFVCLCLCSFFIRFTFQAMMVDSLWFNCLSWL